MLLSHSDMCDPLGLPFPIQLTQLWLAHLPRRLVEVRAWCGNTAGGYKQYTTKSPHSPALLRTTAAQAVDLRAAHSPVPR